MRRLSQPPRRHESSRKGVDPNYLSCPVSRSSNIIISILASSHISSNLGVLHLLMRAFVGPALR